MEGLINKMKNIHRDPSLSPRGLAPGTAKKTSSKRHIPGGLLLGRGLLPGHGRMRSGHQSPAGSLTSLCKLPTPAILVFLAVLAVGLLFLMPGGPLQAQDDGTIKYAENGTGAVATYTAVDPEMTAIVSWSLSGDDAGLFSIERGVLTFKKSPDYEMTGTDNIYMVTVQAMDSTRKTGMEMVAVEVTNVEEAGMVTLSALQPQSNVELTATLTDPDGGITGTTWQWAKASSKNGSYADIDKATSMPYTPDDGDIGSYLRATAMYTDDAEGSGKSAMAKSDYAVQGVRGTNEAPVFPDQDPDMINDQSDVTTRMVLENTAAGQAIGDPVVAEDANGDILTYTLTGEEAGSFDIDWATGQIMTKGALNVEEMPIYTMVMVRATDPSGVPQADPAEAGNSDIITVTIMVTDVNEPPVVTGVASVDTNDGADLTFNEVVATNLETDETSGNIATALDDYMANDPENDMEIIWSVVGADRGKFAISTPGGVLTFKEAPDFEMPGDANGDNVYEVTVVAADSDGNRGTKDVKVTVENQGENGTVTLSRTQPRVGVAVKASLTDPDGSISGLNWQWYQGGSLSAADLPTTECAADETGCVIDGAMSDIHTPTEGDDGKILTAVAMYTDGQGAMKTAVGQAGSAVDKDTRNREPVFVDQDIETDGDQSESAERMVGENTKALAGDDAAATDETADNIGSPINANDPDPNADPLIYTLSGADASLFRVRGDDLVTANVDEGGQIEVAAGTKLDYETKATYMVTLMAEDSFGDSDTIMVTIMVNDVDEVPEVTGDATVEYAENGTGAVATYTAVDPEMTAIASWSLGGDDAGDFSIEGGVLMFKESPDFEMAMDTGTDNIYMVTVQAMDSTRKTGMEMVAVEVTNVEEAGMVTLSALQPQSNVELTATLTDPDGGITGTTWQWAKASSKNGSYADIDKATSMPYTPDDGDIGSYLRATAMYTDDAEGSGKSAMAKSDYAVQGVRGTNEAPVFPDQDPDMINDQSDVTTRMVLENTAAGQAIGDPVVAEDANGDILTYTLTGEEAGSFDIDWATGQIMTKGALNVEEMPIYTMVMVRATDPSGVPQADPAEAGNSDIITVTIMVTDVNEPPVVTGVASVDTNDGADLTFNEVVATNLETDETSGNIATALDDYMANDPENDMEIIWSVVGADRGKFAISTPGGVLTFKEAPDFEMPGDANGDNVYEVTVVAADSDGNRGTKDVKVTVENQGENGTVTLSRTQPRVGVAVKASLTDPDGSISGLNWQWYQGGSLSAADLPTTECAADETGCVIDGAMSDIHTPTEGDDGKILTAVAMYTDGQGAMKTAVGQAGSAVDKDTRNREPVFVDQDIETDGDQSESAERMVGENTKALAGDDAAATDETADNIGSPINANDPDPNADPLIYTLSGADASLFRVRGDDLVTANVDEGGQIEVAAGTKLDYETKATYMVTLMAEDSFGDSDTIMVTIMVTDVDEAPEIMMVPTENQAPVFRPSSTTRSIPEGQSSGRAIGARVTATDPGDSLTYTLEGTDAASFSIDSRTGQLRTSASLDQGTRSSYTVTVRATDSGRLYDTITVTITVTGVDDAMPMDLVDRYDANNNGLELDEVFTAIDDYFDYDDRITLEEVYELVDLYFES